jgi:hypothetical protein
MSDHNHDLSEGDELTDTKRNMTRGVETVHDDGSVTIAGVTYEEDEICAALRDSVLVRERDGKGPELVESY